MTDPKLLPPFLGASAPWLEDDEEVTDAHARRQLANYLREQLATRISILSNSTVSADEVFLELRKQMAAAAVEGNLMLASELSEMLWPLLQSGRARPL